MKDALAEAMPVAISFMPNLAGIGEIAAKNKDVIKELRKPIDKVVEKVVNFVIASCVLRGWQYFYSDFPDQFSELREVNKEKVLAELTHTLSG